MQTSITKRLMLACLVFGMALFSAGQSFAAEVKVLAANALKEAYAEIVANFEKSTGHKVTTVWGGSEAIDKQVRSGDVVDIVIIAATNIDRLILDGKLVAGSRTDFAKSGIGIAIRRGLPKPDVSSAEAIRQTVLEANSVAYSSGPSGFYIVELFKKMGIADQIKDKVRQQTSGVQVGDLLARNEADIGFQQISELMHVKGIDYLGPLPPEIQNTTLYSAALHAQAPSPHAAKALMQALTAPDVKPVLRKIGMELGQ